MILIVSTLSIPLSAFIVQPYVDDRYGAIYTGFSWKTIKENLMPRFSSGAAGSQLPGEENFPDMFGIFFPATSGILAGASMSGDLLRPSNSIPKGTLWGLLSTFVLYFAVILSIGCTVSRELLYKDVEIIRNANISAYVIIMGEFSTSLFSSLMGIVGAAKLLQAISRDNLLPWISAFGKGYTDSDNPLPAIFFSYLLTQVTLLFDINQIAVFITMAFLMTFVVTNLACFLLKIASAPNFRPSFRYFNSASAGFGALMCVLAMFLADGVSASAMIIVLMMLFAMIHYISPPKPWGDVSQSLIYHQVRKYLLRLRQDHVKFWRPQILLLVDDPRTSWSLIHFCNHLKKGGLYILGHVMVTQDFTASFPEMRKQQNAWMKLRDIGHIKGFVQIAAGPNVVWGARNVYMGSGLGGMKPNITVLGFYEKKNLFPGCLTVPSLEETIEVEHLPTDICRKEPSIKVTEWVHIIEDLLTMQANIAIAKGFPRLEFPSEQALRSKLSDKRGYIDLYPIQMSAEIVDENGETSALTTNFDTYTLILQMGAILHTVPVWKANHKLRVVVFVEFEEDVESEKQRIEVLLEKLRIMAEILVLCLNSGEICAYETIVHGKPDWNGRATQFLGDYDWWKELVEARENLANFSVVSKVVEDLRSTDNHEASPKLGKVIGTKKRRHTMSSMQKLGVSYTMQTNRLLDEMSRSVGNESESDESSSEDDTEVEDDPRRPHLFVRRGSSLQPIVRSPHSKTPPPIVQKTPPRQPKLETLQLSQPKPIDFEAPKGPATPRPATPLRPPLMKTLSSSASLADLARAKKLKPHFMGNTIPQTRVLDEEEAGRPTIMFEQGTSRSAGKPSRITFDERSSLVATQVQAKQTYGTNSEPSDATFLSFNDLPARAQHVILNDMMLQTSKDSVVIFSTLPAPALGTYKSEQESLDYIESLELWCKDLPPVVLLHSQSMTVTTAL
jgi:potassium/chloride transporter 9